MSLKVNIKVSKSISGGIQPFFVLGYSFHPQRRPHGFCICFATVLLMLALLREIKDIYFYMNQLVLILLLIVFEISVSPFIGYCGCKMYFDYRLKEIYITKEMLTYHYQYLGRRVR